MKFLKLLFESSTINEDTTKLQSVIENEFSNNSESEIILMTSISGLCARVANSDLIIDNKEKIAIEKILNKLEFLNIEQAKSITLIASREIKNLCGIENHLYAEPLNKILTKNERFDLLKSLFSVAASDGIVSSVEEHEIRLISKSLLLEQKHFLAARSTILDKLGLLN